MECTVPSFYVEDRVKARKPHRCCETGLTIRPGEHYWRCKGCWEGDIDTWNQSESGYHLCRYLNLVVEWDCVIPFGGLHEYVSEVWELNRRRKLRKLVRAIQLRQTTFGPFDALPFMFYRGRILQVGDRPRLFVYQGTREGLKLVERTLWPWENARLHCGPAGIEEQYARIGVRCPVDKWGVWKGQRYAPQTA